MTEQQQSKKLSEAALGMKTQDVLITADSLKEVVHKIINPERRNIREEFHESYKESFGLDD